MQNNQEPVTITLPFSATLFQNLLALHKQINGEKNTQGEDQQKKTQVTLQNLLFSASNTNFQTPVASKLVPDTPSQTSDQVSPNFGPLSTGKQTDVNSFTVEKTPNVQNTPGPDLGNLLSRLCSNIKSTPAPETRNNAVLNQYTIKINPQGKFFY